MSSINYFLRNYQFEFRNSILKNNKFLIKHTGPERQIDSVLKKDFFCKKFVKKKFFNTTTRTVTTEILILKISSKVDMRVLQIDSSIKRHTRMTVDSGSS